MSVSNAILVGRMEDPRRDPPVPRTGVDTGGEFRFVMDEGDADQVRKLLEQGASANTKADHDKYLPLHYALVKRREDMVSALLEHGAVPHARDENGRLPLLLATRLGLADSVGMLLRAGARPFQPLNERQWSALHVASHYGHIDCVRAVLSHNGQDDQKVSEASACSTGGAALLNVPSSKDTGDTPLHLATRGDHVEIVALLLSKGAYVDVRNRPLGHTALHIAAAMGHTEILEILLSYGADPRIESNGATKRTPLEIARDNKHNDCITVLLGAMEEVVDDAKVTINRIERVRFRRSQRESRRMLGLQSRGSAGLSRGRMGDSRATTAHSDLTMSDRGSYPLY
eukprot:g2108.t1